MGFSDVFPFLKAFEPQRDLPPEPNFPVTEAKSAFTEPLPAPPLQDQYYPRGGHYPEVTAAAHSTHAPHQPIDARIEDQAFGTALDREELYGEHVPLHAVPIATPQIEMQPWVRSFIGWLGSSTFGVARIDLKRPTPPDYSQYTGGNIFVVQPARAPQPARGWRARPGRPPGVRAELVGQDSIMVRDLDAPHDLSGARLKITRHVTLGPQGEIPWIDCGFGLNFDMELQKLSPVARIKIKDFASVKAFPTPVLKVGGEWRVFNTSLSLKLHYEVPLVYLRQPLSPPARLLLRLDHVVNSGFKLSPSGVEFDETIMQLGANTSVRAAGGLQFPRQLPIQGELQDAFKLQLHRLGLKTFW